MPKEEKQLSDSRSNTNNTDWYRKLIFIICTFIVVLTGAASAIVITADLFARFILTYPLVIYPTLSMLTVCFIMFSLVVTVTNYPVPDCYTLSVKEKISYLIRASLLGALGWCSGSSAWVSIQIDGWVPLTDWEFEIPTYVFSLVILTSCFLSVTVLLGSVFFTKLMKA